MKSHVSPPTTKAAAPTAERDAVQKLLRERLARLVAERESAKTIAPRETPAT
jgi:hypothetical protein